MASNIRETQQAVEEKVKQRIVQEADNALEIISGYLKGRAQEPNLIKTAFGVIVQSTKIMQMNQVRVLTERSQALRFMPYLKDDKIREEYIKLSNPQIARLALKRPVTTEEQAEDK